MIHSAGLFLYAWVAVWAAGDVASATDTIPASLYPAVETTVDRNEIRIGDEFHLSVTLTHDPSVTVLQQGRDLDLGQFEIKDINFGVTQTLPDGKQQRTITYELSTYFTGEFEIPAFGIQFQTPDLKTGEIRTAPIGIHVVPLTPEESEELDIRDIKAPVTLEGQSRLWMLIAAGAAIAAAALAAYLLRRYGRRRADGAALEPPLSPQEQALRALAALRGERTLFDNREFKEFSIRVSEILRVYIQRRWAFPALEETSREILDGLEARSVPEKALIRFRYFFDDCDLMKFAKHEPGTDDMERLIDLAAEIVHETGVDTAAFAETPPLDAAAAPEPPAEVRG